MIRIQYLFFLSLQEGKGRMRGMEVVFFSIAAYTAAKNCNRQFIVSVSEYNRKAGTDNCL